MDIRQFERKLLDVILLFVGLVIFNLALALLIPLLGLNHNLLAPLVRHSSWIGKLIFGIIVLRMTRGSKALSISIGMLATIMPVFGGLFYLLTLIDNKDK